MCWSRIWPQLGNTFNLYFEPPHPFVLCPVYTIWPKQHEYAGDGKIFMAKYCIRAKFKQYDHYWHQFAKSKLLGKKHICRGTLWLYNIGIDCSFLFLPPIFICYTHLHNLCHRIDWMVMMHSGGEQSLGQTKYIIGMSYIVGKPWTIRFCITCWKNLALRAFGENGQKRLLLALCDFWGKNKALVWLYLHSWTWFDVIIIFSVKFWWFSFFLDPLLLI